jgi:endonuclease G
MPPFNRDHAPRLVDMHRLGPVGLSPLSTEMTIDVAASVTAPESLADREGYAEDFLGEFVVPLPVPDPADRGDVLPVGDDENGRLDYTHFSVVMSRSRRIALFTAVNIDGGESVSVPRGPDRWALDGRIPADAQAGEELYANNGLDRGHLVRREDPNWGADAATANADTFHFTNCSPQMAAFNQQTWLSLEDYILQNTRRWHDRVTVFTGPVFREDDRVYRGIRIPAAFWKVVAFLAENGDPSATAYLIDQEHELSALEFAFGAFKTYQRSVLQIEELTGLSFGELSRYDGFSNEERISGTKIKSLIRNAADIRV